MNRYFTLGLAGVAAFLFAVLSAGITVGRGQNISELQAGLLLACVAVIFLTVRLYAMEKRLAAMERLISGQKPEDGDGEEEENDGPEA